MSLIVLDKILLVQVGTLRAQLENRALSGVVWCWVEEGKPLTCSDPDHTSPLEHRPDPTVFTSNTVGSGSDPSRNKVGKIPTSYLPPPLTSR